jgi:hypothetical protein
MFKAVGEILFLQFLMTISTPIHNMYGKLYGVVYTKLWKAFFTIVSIKSMTKI